MLLGATDRAIRLIDRFAECFTDRRATALIERGQHTGWAADLCAGAGLRGSGRSRRATPRSENGGAGRQAFSASPGLRAAGRQEHLNRLELGSDQATRYHRIAWDGSKIEALFVDLFLEARNHPPKQIILDLDETDDPLYIRAPGRPLLHGYYDCYCYLPLYIYCGPHLLAAKLRRRPDPRPLAADPHSAARRFGVYPRRADAVVRGQWGRFSVWPWPKKGVWSPRLPAS